MSQFRIAAVIPAYNSAASLGVAIASAQGQTRPPDEIIVVDDGSSDETAALAAAAGARVIRQENAGPGAARNRGIAATTAEWIALLDADDRWRPEKIERQLALIGDPRTGIVYAGHEVAGKTPPMPPAETDFEVLWERNRVPTSSVLLRRAAWEQVGGFNTRRDLIGVEDYNLWLRLAHAGWRLLGVEERLVEYLPSSSSLTSQTRRFAAAEITHLGVVAAELSLDAQQVAEKEYRTYLDYGQEFFFYRDREGARSFLAEAGRRGPLPLKARVQQLATLLPLPIWKQG